MQSLIVLITIKMYTVFSCYHHHGLSHTEMIDADKMRSFCLEKIVECLEILEYIDYEIDHDNDAYLEAQKNEYTPVYTYAKNELASQLGQKQPAYDEYPLQRLIKILLELGQLMIMEQNDWGITSIVAGQNLSLYQ